MLSLRSNSAIRRWVLEGGWRDAQYASPRVYAELMFRICCSNTYSHAPPGGLLETYANELEDIAYGRPMFRICYANTVQR